MMKFDQVILSHTLPGLLVLAIVETVYLRKERHTKKDTANTLASITVGLVAIASNLFFNSLVVFFYSLLYNYRLFTIPGNTWWAWAICFFGDDLSYYWFHRCSHQVRFLWASHAVHHTPEKYTLVGGLRVPWTGTLSGNFLFWIWMPFLGVQPAMVIAMKSLSVIYQFWLHTELIKKMPCWFEAVFNTPSHHRVHHASDIEYLDKNHAGTLIIWDKMFGTFKEETFSPTYGLTKKTGSSNPLVIAFTEWKELYSDLKKSRRTKDHLNYLFNSPGWSNDGSSQTIKSSPRITQTLTLQIKIMKHFYLLLLLFLFSANSYAQQKMFLRVYDLAGTKTNKGYLDQTTDSSVILKKGKKTYEVKFSSIGFLRTRHSIGHNFLIIGGAMALIGSTYGISFTHANLLNNSPGYHFSLNSFISDDIALAAGFIAGGIMGSAIAGTTALFKKINKYDVNGKPEEWKKVKMILDQMTSLK